MDGQHGSSKPAEKAKTVNSGPKAKKRAGAEGKSSSMEQGTREIVSEAKAMSELLARLQESLARAADKNDSLLEAIEATEARASREGQAESEVSETGNYATQCVKKLFFFSRHRC